jgi:hypothetical protein
MRDAPSMNERIRLPKPRLVNLDDMGMKMSAGVYRGQKWFGFSLQLTSKQRSDFSRRETSALLKQ